ncbi:MAG: hypothetical protein Q4G71_01180 [Pseudomonadota bacterium]|nr:hypothetical protein [Pseudomonadota bacterium]
MSANRKPKPVVSPDQTTLDVSEGDARPTHALPHERGQVPDGQAPAAGQDDTERAHKAYDDARRNRPDTSSAPQLQRPPEGRDD